MNPEPRLTALARTSSNLSDIPGLQSVKLEESFPCSAKGEIFKPPHIYKKKRQRLEHCKIIMFPVDSY
jgi:hypothetical protein